MRNLSIKRKIRKAMGYWISCGPNSYGREHGFGSANLVFACCVLSQCCHVDWNLTVHLLEDNN